MDFQKGFQKLQVISKLINYKLIIDQVNKDSEDYIDYITWISSLLSL